MSKKKDTPTAMEVVEARITATYDVTGLTEADVLGIPTALQNALFRQVGAGLLTDGTPALVESYSVNVSGSTGRPSLWYVHAETKDGEDASLIVWAISSERAMDFWKKQFEHEDAGEVKWIGAIPESDSEGVVEWSSLRGEDA